MSAPPGRRFPEEAALHRLWGQQRLYGNTVRTLDGDVLRVVFPGWPNKDRGPDFKSAVLRNGSGVLMKGDIELHQRQGDWYRHGHHVDPEYADVMLHVVWSGDPKRDTRGRDGGRIPVAVIEALYVGPPKRVEDLDPRPCVNHRGELTGADVGLVLDAEGDRRLTEKAAVLAEAIETAGPEEALHRALFRALGYSKNREPFAALAVRASSTMLTGAALAEAPAGRIATLEALLMGAAGLLPSQRGLPHASDPWATELEGRWAVAPLPRAEPLRWQHFRVRPGGSPARRVAAAARLVARFAGEGARKQLERSLAQAGPRGVFGALRRLLTVEDKGYWGRHWDFGRPGPAGATLVGSSRAAEITVNVVLPFFVALYRLDGNRAGAERCRSLYVEHPPLSANRITLQMERMLLREGASKVVTTARRQQGLIGLYTARCYGLVCQGCGVADAVSESAAIREAAAAYRTRPGARPRRWERPRRAWCRPPGSRSTWRRSAPSNSPP